MVLPWTTSLSLCQRSANSLPSVEKNWLRLAEVFYKQHLSLRGWQARSSLFQRYFPALGLSSKMGLLIEAENNDNHYWVVGKELPVGSPFHRFDRFITTGERKTQWIGEIISYFERRTTNGVIKGINNKLKLIKRAAYGFRNFEHFRLKSLLCWCWSYHFSRTDTEEPQILVLEHWFITSKRRSFTCWFCQGASVKKWSNRW